MPAVVVLPLVALITVAPPVRRAPRREIASGSSRSSTRPGRVVPPPRPLARLAAPIARERASLAPNSGRGRDLGARAGALKPLGAERSWSGPRAGSAGAPAGR